VENIKQLGEGKKYFLRTYGCQMNERDSETIAGIIMGLGYEKAASAFDADLIIFNTCCVRESAERKIYGRLNELRRLKNNKPNILLGVGGCMAQKDKERVLTKAPHVDFIFGTHNLGELPEIIRQAAATKEPIVQVWDQGKEPLDLPTFREGSLKAFVTITYGCTNFCTYCIVPYVRGQERSRYPEEIIEEVKQLSATGYKEITLLGQNVNTYGLDLGLAKINFAYLLKAVNEIPGIERIRYTTSHPRDFSQEIIAAVKNCEKVCEHFHLPVQAGSNRVLARMNRGYTREDYFALIKQIREAVPNNSITTDLIVGFPGETDADFQDTLDLVQQVKFDNAFTFIYSPRSGTPAAVMPGQVPEAIKRERLNQLMELQDSISRQINEKLRHQVVEVLVEGISDKDNDYLKGRTRTNKLVLFPGKKELVGQLVPVKITRPQTWNLYGDLI
jgi:tRNA-2-methylthio-N6-dimethylallyladenosine synthase